MTFQPDNFTVWAEIPATDLDRAIGFYNAVLQIEMEKEQMGPDVTAIFRTKDPTKGVAGHIYTGRPAGNGTGPTVHLAAPGKLEKTLERVKTAGGTVISEPVRIPAGRFAYALDLDGNSIGLFEI